METTPECIADELRKRGFVVDAFETHYDGGNLHVTIWGTQEQFDALMGIVPEGYRIVPVNSMADWVDGIEKDYDVDDVTRRLEEFMEGPDEEDEVNLPGPALGGKVVIKAKRRPNSVPYIEEVECPPGHVLLPVEVDKHTAEAMEQMDLADTGEMVTMPKWAADYLLTTDRHHSYLYGRLCAAYETTLKEG